jgi:hypothetical protein
MATTPTRRHNSAGHGFATSGLGNGGSLDDGDVSDCDALLHTHITRNSPGSGESSGSGYSNSSADHHHHEANANNNQEGLWTGPFRPRNRSGSGSGGGTVHEQRTISRRRGSSPSSLLTKSSSTTRTAKVIIGMLLLAIVFLLSVLVDKKSLRRFVNLDRAESKSSGDRDHGRTGIGNTSTNSRTHFKRLIGYFAVESDDNDNDNDNAHQNMLSDTMIHTTCHAFKRDRHCLRLPLKGERQVQMTEYEKEMHWHFLQSPKLKEADPFVLEDCIPMHTWQTLSYPTCNALHESDLTHWMDHDHHRSPPTNFARRETIADDGGDDHDSKSRSNTKKYDNKAEAKDIRLKLVNHGHYRDVWVIPDNDVDHPKYLENNHHRVVKTLRMDQDYTPRNYDRHRRDAMAMERLTFSPYVVDIYGYCGNSGMFEYSPGGDVYNAITMSRIAMVKKLEIAVQVAKGLADLHTFEDDGVASIAHTDFGPNQIVKVDGIFKLNDFNRARFIRKHNDTGLPCTYYVSGNPGSVRAFSRSAWCFIYYLNQIYIFCCGARSHLRHSI